MAHPLVLGLFRDKATAATAARALRELGLDPGTLSVVAKSHEEEGELASSMGATPGAEIEDSWAAARLGELGGQVRAAIALVLPGIGPIVSAGPLAADLGEAAGHMAGSVASVLGKAGLPERRAAEWQSRVRQGAVILGAHTTPSRVAAVETALRTNGAADLELARWE